MILLDDVGGNELGNLALRDDRVAEVETTVLPLHRAVHVQRVTQPVVRRTPEQQQHMTSSSNHCDERLNHSDRHMAS